MSRALRRATVVSQAVGSAGIPLVCQDSSAAVKAPATASSATSRSRVRRTTVARTRAQSRRCAVTTADSTSVFTPLRGPPHRADLRGRSGRTARRDRQRLVEVPGLDQVEAPDLLLE